MANPLFLEAQSVASGVVAGLASAPSTAEAFKVRVETATCRWSLNATPNASLGLLITPADPPLLVAAPSLAAFHLFPLAAAQFNIAYFQGGDTFKL